MPPIAASRFRPRWLTTFVLAAALTGPLATAIAVTPEAAPAVAACGTAPAGMACIPGGAFLRGRDDGPKNERPQASVWVQTGYMDVFEVTFADYQRCVREGGCKAAKPLYSDFNRPRQPMVGMTWFDAVAYCQHVGKHLPTEAEWERAARGADGRRYPWGNDPATCERTIIEDARGRSCGVPKAGKERLAHVGRTFEIGSRPATLHGLHDMAGNAWEWVADWYSEDYGNCGAKCTGVNPRGPCDGAKACPGFKEKLVRGGSWYWDATHATTTFRRPHAADNVPYSHFGFRCAASIDEAVRLAARPVRDRP